MNSLYSQHVSCWTCSPLVFVWVENISYKKVLRYLWTLATMCKHNNATFCTLWQLLQQTMNANKARCTRVHGLISLPLKLHVRPTGTRLVRQSAVPSNIMHTLIHLNHLVMIWRTYMWCGVNVALFFFLMVLKAAWQ